MGTKEYYQFVTDFWKFLKSFLPVRSDDEYWSQLMDGTREFVADHDNSRFAKDLMLATVDELEREEMRMRKSNNGHDKGSC